MDEQTFMVHTERAVDYLNSLDKVFVNDQFLNWGLENRSKFGSCLPGLITHCSCTTCVSDPLLKSWRILVLRTSLYTMLASSRVIVAPTT
ncbi:hypothetical protein ACFX1X_020254 [Malus domestica]